MNAPNIFTMACIALALTLQIHVVGSRFMRRISVANGRYASREVLVGLFLLLVAAATYWRTNLVNGLSNHPLRGWIILGILSLLGAVVLYVRMYRKARTSFMGLKMRVLLSDLISHVDNEDDTALPHIFAGVLGSLGVCLLTGAVIGSALNGAQELNTHSIALTSGGLMFAVLISGISFWTLYQTKRIEEIQGSVISSFRGLIEAMTDQLRRVNDDFRLNRFNAHEHHRVLIVTTNPCFGLLSFPDEKFTEDFADEMRHAASNVNRGAEKDGEKYKMEILCGSPEIIMQFHRNFYKTPGDLRIEQKSQKTETFIKVLETEAGTNIVSRANEILNTQFAIIGNVVFEFVLETPGHETEIHQARRIREKVVCDRFRELFDLLKRLSATPPTSPPTPAPPTIPARESLESEATH